MAERAFNFSAGPAMLPEEVLAASAAALVDYQGRGVGIAELSHRGPEIAAVIAEASERCRALLDVPAEYDILFLQGGASQLFTTIPMNFLAAGGQADYVVTGDWAKKAAEAARLFGAVRIAGSSEASGFDRLPEWTASPDSNYLYVCSNETINGTRWDVFPDHPTLIADVSSEFMARPIPVGKFAMLFGGAQKNLGPAGVVLVIVRRDLYAISRIGAEVPEIFDFAVHARANSGFNTPPTFAIYMLLETLRWLDRQGGLAAMEARNEAKAALIYAVVDALPDFYQSTVHDLPARRSRMNITFRLPSKELTTQFLAEAEARGMLGLAGYRTVGGIRASIYNAMPESACAALADFMRAFARAR